MAHALTDLPHAFGGPDRSILTRFHRAGTNRGSGINRVKSHKVNRTFRRARSRAARAFGNAPGNRTQTASNLRRSPLLWLPGRLRFNRSTGLRGLPQ